MEQIILEFQYLARVVLGLLLGFAIGYERKLRYKEAGMRTHAIVAGGASLIMIISKYGFTDINGGDGARVAAQIVSGIGFLGAGMIIYKREALHGLTTAAGIWTTAGVGMCAGAGLYTLAVGAAILIILTQCFMHLRIKLFETKKFYSFKIKYKCTNDENQLIKDIFSVDDFVRVAFYNEPDHILMYATIRTERRIKEEEVKTILNEYDFILSIERTEE